MEIKGSYINFNNDDNSRVRKNPEPSPAPKQDEKKTPEKETPVNPEYWQNRVGISFGNKKEASEEKNYTDALEELFDKTPLDSSFSYRLSNAGAKKLYELIQKGTFTPEGIAALSNKLSIYTAEDRDAIEPLVAAVYDICAKENNEAENNANAEYITNLASPFLSVRRITPKNFIAAIKDFTPFERTAAEFFAQKGKEANESAFAELGDFKKTVASLDENNFESYKTSFAKRGEGSSLCDATYMMSCFVNPKTKKYDSLIEEKTKEFEAKRQSLDYMNRFFGYSEVKTAKIVRAMVDLQTGQISEKAVNFTNDYLFGDKVETEDNKFVAFIKNLRSKRYIFAPPYYKDSYSMRENFADLLDDIKDNTGAFNDTNIKYMSKFLESKSGWGGFSDELNFFKFLKDENGVAERGKFAFAQKILDETNDMKKTGEIVQIYATIGKKNFDSIYKFLRKMYDKEDRNIYQNLAVIAKNCFDDKGKPIEDKIELIRELTNDFSYAVNFTDPMFEAMENEYCKKILLSIKDRPGFSGYDILGLSNLKQEHCDKNGEITPHAKEKLEEFLKTGITLGRLPLLYNSCFSKNENGEQEFDEKGFQNILDLISFKTDECKRFGKVLLSRMNSEVFIDIAQNSLNVNTMKFKSKITLYEELKKLNFDNIGENDPIAANLKKLFYEIDASLTADSHSLPVDRKYIEQFAHNIFSIAKNGEYSDFEATLKDSISKLEKMENGLPLSYSREDFLSDLSQLLDSEEKIKAVENKTEVSFNYEKNGSEINILGYEGILTPDKLDRSDKFENEIYGLCHNFMYNNSVNTGDKKLDEQLNSIIKAAPEFINTIGKKQHGTHKHTLDIHQLLVLARSIDNPDYLKLDDLDKAMLKITALFHDIAKQEGVVDKGHQEPSALYSRGIVRKFIKNPETVERIYELIKNHHWTEEYANAADREEAAKAIAFKFRRPNDFEIAKIIARSDLMSVNDEFYEPRKDILTEDKLLPIEEKLNMLYASGNAIFSDYIVRPNALDKHKEVHEGKEYKVINLHKIQDDESLANYGFRNVSKKDAKFLVHMLPDGNTEKDIEILRQLTSSVNGGVLSESLITPKYKKTYCNRKFGVLLSQINPNVINMADKNQGSGNAKDITNAIHLVFSDFSNNRNNFKQSLLENLGIDPKKVSDKEYANFYKKNIALKSSISNFVDSKEYTIGKFKATGKQIKDAIAKYQDSLIDKEEKNHNEIVGYVPKIQGIIAKSKSLDDIPEELLEFAHKSDYPIILI